jgi:WD40 repeat protein
MTGVSRNAAFFVILLAACSPAVTAAPPTETSAGSPATTPSPSLTASSATVANADQYILSRTAAPGPTAAPLPPEGPYFAFIHQEGDAFTLTFIGADGIGRRDIPLPEGADAGNGYSGLISPDGEWLAYWTGFAGEPSYKGLPASDGPFDLQLNLLHIPDNTTKIVASLLSPDYPANFEKNAKAVKGLPQFQDEDVSTIAGYLRDTFLDGIRSAAWSPDSRYLAFAGEMDGPSSDLYAYDSTDETIRRLSSGSRNLAYDGWSSIRWSPDGRWIVYTGTYIPGAGMTVRFYAARPDGSLFRDFPDEVTGWHDWVSPSQFLVASGENGIGAYGLRIADLVSGKMSMIWRCPYYYYAYDPEGRTLLFVMHGSVGLQCEDVNGLFLHDSLSGDIPIFIGVENYPDIQPFFLGQGDRRFLAYVFNTGTYAISRSGTASLLLDDHLFPNISPDRQWVAFAGNHTSTTLADGKSLRIMDASGNISEPLVEMEIDEVLWRPDSEGFLYYAGSDVYYVSISDRQVVFWEDARIPSQVEKTYWRPDSQGFFFLSESDLYFLSIRNRSVTKIQDNLSWIWFDPAWIAVSE